MEDTAAHFSQHFNSQLFKRVGWRNCIQTHPHSRTLHNSLHAVTPIRLSLLRTSDSLKWGLRFICVPVQECPRWKEAAGTAGTIRMLGLRAAREATRKNPTICTSGAVEFPATRSDQMF